MMVDPQQATDAFLALSQAAATAGGAAAAAKASGAAAASQAAGTASAKASAAASAAAVGAGGLSVESLLKQLAGVQAAISALPAVVLKDPAIKSALASLQGIAGALQGEEAKVIKTLQSIPQVKQLQGELTALAKTLEGYKQAASARLSVETLIRQLPAPLQTIEKMAEKMLQDLAAVVTVISRDSDKELFNGYPFNPQALVLWAASVCAYSSVAWRDEDAVPYRAGDYDPAAAEKFYAKRWAHQTCQEMTCQKRRCFCQQVARGRSSSRRSQVLGVLGNALGNVGVFSFLGSCLIALGDDGSGTVPWPCGLGGCGHG